MHAHRSTRVLIEGKIIRTRENRAAGDMQCTCRSCQKHGCPPRRVDVPVCEGHALGVCEKSSAGSMREMSPQEEKE